MIKINIEKNYITIGQLIKKLSLISSGGESKFFLENNNVFINEKRIFQRGKKIYEKDKIYINEKEYILIKKQ